MLGSDINFFYYSGTGNTLLIVKEIAGIFSEKGIQVNLHKIETTDPRNIDTGKPMGLAFPVAFQSTFPFVWDFINKLPQAANTPVFMVDTKMAFSGAVVGPLKKILTAKGYICIGACEINMPNNWLPKRIDAEKNTQIINSGLKRARRYAEELINGKTCWNRIPFLSKGLLNLCSNDFVMKQICLADGRKITVDINKCIKCGLCARLCPVKNIEMKDHPLWHNSCQLCTRCLNYCPVQAVVIPGKEFDNYQAVKAKTLLKEKNNYDTAAVKVCGNRSG